jgi:hypothetical protein
MYIDGFSADDSQPHTVQIYSDISAGKHLLRSLSSLNLVLKILPHIEWATRDDNQLVVWDTTENNDIIYHSVTRQNPQFMVENDDIAEDGTAYYAILNVSPQANSLILA